MQKFILLTLISVFIFGASSKNAHAQITEQTIKDFLNQSATLIRDETLQNPQIVKNFMQMHLGEGFRFIDNAVVTVNGNTVNQPVVRDKETYIDEALNSLNSIISVTPKLNIKTVAVMNGGKVGKSTYDLTSVSTVRDPQLKDFYGTDTFIIQTSSKCEEHYSFSDTKQTLQSERLACRSQITFKNRDF